MSRDLPMIELHHVVQLACKMRFCTPGGAPALSACSGLAWGPERKTQSEMAAVQTTGASRTRIWLCSAETLKLFRDLQ